jgi:hypothetical protein
MSLTRSSAAAVFVCIGAFVLCFGGAIGLEAQTTQACGNEGELACPISTSAPRCDTGLDMTGPQVCGCAVSGPFGICLVPRVCRYCVNSTRHSPAGRLFNNYWVSWALRNQQNLTQDEPLNWVARLGTHNSFNSLADGHRPVVLPNQLFSITDQLKTGARLLTLDLHYLEDNARLCHAFSEDGFGIAPCFTPGSGFELFPPGLRFYSNAIKEIRNWMNRNPNEIVLINTEEYVDESHLLDPLRAYFGSRLLPSPLTAPPGFTNARWPTRREMLASGRRVVVFSKTGPYEGTAFSEPAVVGPFSENWYARNLRRYPNCPGANIYSADSDTDRFTFVSTLGGQLEGAPQVSNGDLVYFEAIQNAALPGGILEDTPYYVVGLDAGRYRVSSLRGGPAVDVTSSLSVRVFASPRLYSTLTVEDREWGQFLNIGVLDTDDVVSATECNYTFMALDQFSASVIPGGEDTYARQEATVWSWQVNDYGSHPCAVMAGATGRWTSADCNTPLRFACAKPRSESGLDPLDWTDPLGRYWRITAAAAPWDQGHTLCETEFPGYVAGVPVNGYQNRILKDVNIGRENLWLNYSRRDGAAWAIRRRTASNAPPLAEAGEDQLVEHGTIVRLDGSGSTDPNGHTLTYTWSGPFGTLSGPVVETTLELGEHPIVLTVNDGHGGVDTDSLVVTIQDTTPPTLTVDLSPGILWPPNKQLIDIIATITANDSADDEAPVVELLSIVSTQAGQAKPPTGTRPRVDIAGADIGTDDREFQLRAQLEGLGERTYSVTYRAIDLSGNATVATDTVVVGKTLEPGGVTTVPKRR